MVLNPLRAVGHLRLEPPQLFDVLVDAVVAQLTEVAQHRVDLARIDLLALQHPTELLGLARPALDLAAELTDVLRAHPATSWPAVAVAASIEGCLAKRQSITIPAGRGIAVRVRPALSLLPLLTLLAALPLLTLLPLLTGLALLALLAGLTLLATLTLLTLLPLTTLLALLALLALLPLLTLLAFATLLPLLAVLALLAVALAHALVERLHPAREVARLVERGRLRIRLRAAEGRGSVGDLLLHLADVAADLLLEVRGVVTLDAGANHRAGVADLVL